MDDLNRALGDISSIRQQMARSTEFRGYGPATMAATGIFAIAAAVAQALRVPDPSNHLVSYLCIWLLTALASAVLIAVQTVTRAHRMHSGIANEMIYMAVEQFLPAAGAGALLTLVLVQYASSAAWMLPGLWQITFSLGVFSSCRFLPRAMVAAGMWYLLTGLTCIALGDSRAFSPWTMGVSFGVGQFLAAGILFFNASESRDET
jgi:magnesium-transporting ATPase (P-type)